MRPSRGGGVSSLALGTFAVGTDAFVVAGFLPAMSVDLDVSVAVAGQSVTLFAVAGAAAYTPNAGVVAAALVPAEKRGRALALVVSGLTLATALGVPLGTIAARVMGWRSALVVVALLSGAIAALLLVLLPRLDGGTPVPLRTRFAVLRNRTVRMLLPVTILGMTAAYTAYAYAVPSFASLGIAADDSPWLLFAYGVGAVIGAQSSGRLTDRYGGARVLVTGYAVMACVLAALGALSASSIIVPALVAVLALAWGASSWCQSPPLQHRLIDAAPEHASLVIAFNASSIYIGIGTGTAIGGLAGSAHVPAMFFTGAAIAVITGAWVLTTRR